MVSCNRASVITISPASMNTAIAQIPPTKPTGPKRGPVRPIQRRKTPFGRSCQQPIQICTAAALTLHKYQEHIPHLLALNSSAFWNLCIDEISKKSSGWTCHNIEKPKDGSHLTGFSLAPS